MFVEHGTTPLSGWGGWSSSLPATMHAEIHSTMHIAMFFASHYACNNAYSNAVANEPLLRTTQFDTKTVVRSRKTAKNAENSTGTTGFCNKMVVHRTKTVQNDENLLPNHVNRHENGGSRLPPFTGGPHQAHNARKMHQNSLPAQYENRTRMLCNGDFQN